MLCYWTLPNGCSLLRLDHRVQRGWKRVIVASVKLITEAGAGTGQVEHRLAGQPAGARSAPCERHEGKHREAPRDWSSRSCRGSAWIRSGVQDAAKTDCGSNYERGKNGDTLDAVRI